MRWIFRVLGAVAALIFLALATFLLIPEDRLAGLVADRLSATLGREVAIEGGVQAHILPVPVLVAVCVRFAFP